MYVCVCMCVFAVRLTKAVEDCASERAKVQQLRLQQKEVGICIHTVTHVYSYIYPIMSIDIHRLLDTLLFLILSYLACFNSRSLSHTHTL